MGLEAVELVMDVEDHFGIIIQTTEAERFRTVGDLVVLIHGRIAAAQEAYCPTLPAFLKLRATVRNVTGDSAFRIRPQQRIVDRLNVPERRELWKQLTELLGSPPRGLRRPLLLRQILGATVISYVVISLMAALAIDVRIWPLTIALAVVCTFLLHIATVRFRTVPPDGWITFGDITTKVVSVTFATKQLQLRTADDILCELRPLIAEVLGVNGDEIVASARFIEDLGVG